MTSQPLVCLITGASAGIGLAAARALAEKDHHVVLLCRDRSRGEAARGAVPGSELLLADLSDQVSVRQVLAEFHKSHKTLDVLVNNAGVAPPRRTLGAQGIELTWATNVLAYHMMSMGLLNALRAAKQGRVINVASGMAYGLDLHDVEFQRRDYDKAAAYAQSKQADRMLTWALARRLKGTKVTANAMTPGAVSTQLLHSMYPGMAGKTPEQGADTVVWLATEPKLAGVSGKYWSDRREASCSFQDQTQQEALWSLCDRMTA